MQGESNSIVHQREMLSRYAKENGYTDTRFFVDDGFSGTTFSRPGWQELMVEVDAGNVCAVIIKDMSRMGRDYLRVGLFMERFASEGIRLIAINDGVDTSKGVDDFTPFRNIISEWYARDISKKIKTVMHTKALKGEHLSGVPLYGYAKSSVKKGVWIVDEEAAEVVREIYQLCMNGYGPTQIAKILNARKIDSVSIHQRKIGLNAASNNIYWQTATVKNILGNMQYLGHTVSCKTHKESYRSKHTSSRPKEDWIIIENTHPAIVDTDTWERVQKLRKNTRKRPSTIGEMGALNGMLFCADCNKHLRIHRSQKSSQTYICPTYQDTALYGEARCTLHSTPRSFIEELVLSEIQRVTAFARERETEFIALVEKTHARIADNELRSNKQELAKAHQRINELDHIIQRIYEDNVSGRLSDERFNTMLNNFESEQAALKIRADELTAIQDAVNEGNSNVTRFLKLVKKYTDVSELTPEIVRVFIERVVAHQGTGRRWHRQQEIDIYYNFIGLIGD
jgi:DNA invertase Pin-like site-specific DNA recombinase